MTVFNFMENSSIVLGSFSVAVIVNKWIVIPIVFLFVLFVYFRKYFLLTSTEIKRIEGISRSPIFVHINNTLSGLSTIRAANMQKVINDEFYVHTDFHTKAFSSFIFINRWFGFRLGNLLSILEFPSVVQTY